jgi:F-type H+-transporting ATPase subunit gamma
MANLKDIKKRIISVKSTQQITKAMKMVAAARFRKAQQAIEAARPYADKMQQVLASLAMREDPEVHPLLQQHDRRGRARVLVLSSDRGLCAGFNLNVAKAAEQFIRDNADGFDSYEVVVIGRKGREQLKVRGLIADKVYEDLAAGATYATASLIGQEVVEGYEQGEVDAVYLVYNAFFSAIRQEVTIDRLLPITPAEATPEVLPVQPLYEPSRSEVLSSILPKHVEVQIYRAFLESLASEHGARMSAMESATKNAEEMIGLLTLQYNRARQAYVTKELMEIVSGAEALK